MYRSVTRSHKTTSSVSLLSILSSLEIQEPGRLIFEIPVDRLTNTDNIDLKSCTLRVGPLDVYLRLTAGRGAESTVNVQLCAEEPAEGFSVERVMFDRLHVKVMIAHELDPRVGGVVSYGESILDVEGLTDMDELDDGSGDKGAGGSLSVERYSSRVMYDGDGEVTTDGPGSAAERAGEAAG